VKVEWLEVELRPLKCKSVLFLLAGRFFAPQGRQVAPIKVKFGREEQSYDPVLPAKFHLDWLRGVGLQPPKL